MLLTVLTAAACGVPDEYARSWESLHRGKFLPGYLDYRGEVDGTDDGYVLMSYTLPAGLAPELAIERIIDHVTTQFPCYKVAERRTHSLLLRCLGGPPRHGGMYDEEYQFLVRPASRRVYVLTQNRIPGEEYIRFPKLIEKYSDQRE